MELNVTEVRVAMARAGIRTQKELAGLIGISENAISDLLNGEATPSLETLGRLCGVLDVTPNDVLTMGKVTAPAM